MSWFTLVMDKILKASGAYKLLENSLGCAPSPCLMTALSNLCRDITRHGNVWGKHIQVIKIGGPVAKHVRETMHHDQDWRCDDDDPSRAFQQ